MGHAARALGDRHGRMRTVLVARGACLSRPIGLPSAAPFEPLAGFRRCNVGLHSAHGKLYRIHISRRQGQRVPGSQVSCRQVPAFQSRRRGCIQGPWASRFVDDGAPYDSRGADGFVGPRRLKLASRSAKSNQCTAQRVSRLDQLLSVHRSTSTLNHTQPVSRISGSAEKFAWMGNPSRDVPLVTDHPESTGHRALGGDGQDGMR